MTAPNTSARSTHAGQGRVVVNRNTHAVDPETQIEALFATRALWELAAMVPPQPTGGPRKLHPVIYCSMFGLQAIFGSFRKAEANLRKVTTGDGTGLWDRLCDHAGAYQAEFRPADEPIDVAALKRRRPLTAQNFFDARASFLAPYMDQIENLFEAAADEAAREIGYADQDSEGSINNLVRERTATGDGKVVRALGTRYRLLTFDELISLRKKRRRTDRADFVVDTTTGELISPDDMIGEELYKTGGGLKIGYKINAISIRDDHANSTVVLRLRMQRTTAEAQELTEAAIDVKAKHPGLLGFIMDGALTGTHHRQLMRRGIVPISPIKAESIAADGERTEKTGLIESITHTHPHGFECRHDLHYHGGEFGEYAIADDGESYFVSLGAPKIQHRPGKARDRMYALFTSTCRVGLSHNEPTIELGDLRYDVAQDAALGKNGCNFAENIRLVPPGSDVYNRTYGWRENSENDNRQRDDEKWGARARSRTVQRQLWNEIGAALLQNGTALLLHRHRVATNTVTQVKRHGHSRRDCARQDPLAELAAA